MGKKATVAPSFFEELVSAMDEGLEAMRGKGAVRRTELDLPDEPPRYSAKDIRNIRDGLAVSQPVFAALLGVSAKAVQAWEQGDRSPAGTARRLLQLMQRAPQLFKQRRETSKTVRRAGRVRA